MDILHSISRILMEEDNFLISSHVRPDGDSIGSQLAITLILQKLNKRFELINPDSPKTVFSFLPLFDRISTYKDNGKVFSVSIILDCGKWSRIGQVEHLAKKSRFIINIDHHRDSEGVKHFNYIHPSSSSTGEILFKLISYMDIPLDTDIATCIYIAILLDTGRFRYSNTTTETHHIIAQLIETGLNPEDLVNRVLAHETPFTLKSYYDILETLQIDSESKIAWCKVNKNFLEKNSFAPADVNSDKIFDELRTLRDFDVFLLFFEIDDKIKVNFRSNYGIDVSPIARYFDKKGHAQTCSCFVDGNLLEMEQDIIERIKKIYQKERN